MSICGASVACGVRVVPLGVGAAIGLMGVATFAWVLTVGLSLKVRGLTLALLGLAIFACCTLVAPLLPCEGC